MYNLMTYRNGGPGGRRFDKTLLCQIDDWAAAAMRLSQRQHRRMQSERRIKRPVRHSAELGERSIF